MGMRASMDEESYREISQLHQGVHVRAYLVCGECCKPWPYRTLVLTRKLRNLECSLLDPAPTTE